MTYMPTTIKLTKWQDGQFVCSVKRAGQEAVVAELLTLEEVAQINSGPLPEERLTSQQDQHDQLMRWGNPQEINVL